MCRGQGREQWNKLSLSNSSLSHATVNLMLPLTEIMDLEANLNWKYVPNQNLVAE